jgi:hypothetical protein
MKRGHTQESARSGVANSHYDVPTSFTGVDRVTVSKLMRIAIMERE